MADKVEAHISFVNVTRSGIQLCWHWIMQAGIGPGRDAGRLAEAVDRESAGCWQCSSSSDLHFYSHFNRRLAEEIHDLELFNVTETAKATRLGPLTIDSDCPWRFWQNTAWSTLEFLSQLLLPDAYLVVEQLLHSGQEYAPRRGQSLIHVKGKRNCCPVEWF